MANIADKVALIRQAIYGKDVRENIASGIEAINTEVVNTTGRQNVIDSQEQTRINAENTRIANENTRLSQEQLRIANENVRTADEIIRQSNETSRQNIFSANELERNNTFDNNENERGVLFNSLKTEITDAITGVNTATINANTATSNYNSVVEQTRKIYKPSVANYASLLTTYPTPEIGWTVTTKDSNIEYRWDGVDWMDVGSSDPSVGFNVVVGLTAPANPNSIWLDAPVTTRYSRVVPSVTQPTDLNQIWWETDN